MSDATPRAPKQAFIAEHWGESFVHLADNPRIEFEEGAIVVTLWKSIRINGEPAAKLPLEEPTLDQLKQLDRIAGDTARTHRLLMQCAKLSEKEAGAVGMRDLMVFGAIMDAFSGAARVTGA